MDDSTNSIQREAFSVAETCAVTGIGRTKLYEAIGTGALVARRFGKKRLILREDLRRFLAKLPTT
jgi:excisionase family DNA binding protein